MKKRFVKKTVGMFLCVLLLFSSAGCTLTEEQTEETTEETYTIRIYSKDELKNGCYYIKHGDEFYKIPEGDYNFAGNEEWGVEKDTEYTVAEEEQPDPERSFFYERDKSEKVIPTMYKDDELVYKTQNNITSILEWERFADAGYTLGIRGIYLSDSGTLNFTNYYMNILDGSEFAKIIGRSGESENENSYYDETDADEEEATDNAEENIDNYWEYTLAAINDTPVVESDISASGTLQGLDPEKEYTADIRKGTICYSVTSKPTARLFYNFENYWTQGVSFSEDGYAAISVPEAFQSGYYKLNESGLFRYVAQNYQTDFDLGSINYNKAYYPLDKDGKVIYKEEESEKYLYQD